ncbi:polymer-forming cytoskeletal protein [Hyphomicrobium sp.]|uniref:bactofilin family protein n=1 Tax=Hyphomicrobium sp. TaxID=82 RepID=UPI000FB69850|nr:polymer-forming cytoskeletal protein [Hyphomicrobium sp.]MBN9248024.1 polymer-forming cytoskeletal protein [Hyphomicrobium sp.]RUP09714.1 MAG: polymer-forming cytoskeletal protein [Hyphomicrobium sp.]
MFNRVATPDSRGPEPVKTLTPAQQQPIPQMKAPAPPLFGSPLQQSGPVIDAPTSVLGQDITIAGQQLVIKTKGSLLIAGHIQGDVHGESVTVGETGSVVGTITARTITVQGEVSGALKGTSVNLNATSRVDGDIVKQTLSIDEGAQFDGSVRRAKDAGEVTPDLN